MTVINPIDPGAILRPSGLGDAVKDVSSREAVSELSGGNVFSQILNEISKLDSEAAHLEEAMYAGEPVELHQVIIAGEKAGVAFELLVEARNRLVEAYQELMRMPV